MQGVSPRLADDYDVVVCGAGPGGLSTVLHLQALLGWRARVALLDERLPWREPAACGEGVHAATLRGLVEVDEEWVRGPVDGIRFVSPSGAPVLFRCPGSGLLINRALMQRRLAERCETGGAACSFDAQIRFVSAPGPDGRRTVHYRRAGEKCRLQARFVVDATGPGKGLGEAEDLAQSNFDVEPAVFFLIRGVTCQASHITLFFGQRVAPGGYAWVFPRDSRTANVGLVLGRGCAPRCAPRQMLETFVTKRWPAAEVLDVGGGLIPCGGAERPLVSRGLFKVGDAANAVNPMSRSGILEAMKMGRHTAHSIASVFASPRVDWEAAGRRLQRAWSRDEGKAHMQLHRAKGAFATLPDAVLDRSAHRLSRIPDRRRTLFRIFWTTLPASPLLLWRMRSLLRWS